MASITAKRIWRFAEKESTLTAKSNEIRARAEVSFRREERAKEGAKAMMAFRGGKLGCLRRQNGHLILRLTADSFPRLLSISNSTACPSFSELRPARSTAEMWTNTSLPPPEG